MASTHFKLSKVQTSTAALVVAGVQLTHQPRVNVLNSQPVIDWDLYHDYRDLIENWLQRHLQTLKKCEEMEMHDKIRNHEHMHTHAERERGREIPITFGSIQSTAFLSIKILLFPCKPLSRPLVQDFFHTLTILPNQSFTRNLTKHEHYVSSLVQQ